MKHLLCTLLLTLTVCLCSAQTEHMKFKGIPMEGTLQSFTLKLKAKGYVPLGTEDGVSVLKGEFAGYKNCHIYAVADKSGMICRVCVEFPKMDKWSDLESCYSSYKDMLTEKYGEPKVCVEEFQNKYADDDNSRMYEVKFDRCKYHSTFACKNGDITLEIIHQKFDCFVQLSYYDKANQDKLRQNIMEDL